MDALHLHRDMRMDKWNNARIVGLSGTLELIQYSVDKIIKHSPEKVVTHLHPQTMQEVYEEVAQTDVDVAPRLYIIHDGMPLIRESDLVKLDKLSSKNYFSTTLVFTGSFSADMSKKNFTRLSQRFYDRDFSKTETGINRATLWLRAITDCDKPAAEAIIRETEYDMARIVTLARKISVFDTFTVADVKVLASEFVSERFVKALVELDYVKAMDMAKQVPPYAVPAVLANITQFVKTISQVHPVTRVVKTPTKQQSIDFKLSMNVLQRWWHVAGRYPPEHQIRRLVILAEASHRYYTISKVGILENLVLAW